jgi:glycosyltransferase involved in cell wall biosynthesis
MKILLISSNSSGTGGGEYYLIYLATALIQFGHEVHALLSEHAYMNSWVEKLEQAGAIVHRLPLAAHLDRPLRFIQAQFDFAQQQRIRRLCLELKPDIIHTNHQYDEDGLDLPLAVEHVAPHIATIHLPMCATKDKRPLGKWRGQFLKGWYRKHSYSKIFVSQQALKEFTTYYPHSGLSFAIPNGVVTLATSLSLEPRYHYQKPLTLGFVGRLNFQKDPLLLAQMWVLLRQKIPECRLLIAGDGEMRSQIENYLKTQAPKGNWQILGWIDNAEQLQEFYTQLDLLILTSQFESAVPLVLMEAAALGIPTIALKIPEYLEFQHQVPILQLIDERDPNRMMQAVLQEYQQERLLKAATPDAVIEIRNYFSLTRMARSTIEAYETTIKEFHQRH